MSFNGIQRRTKVTRKEETMNETPKVEPQRVVKEGYLIYPAKGLSGEDQKALEVEICSNVVGGNCGQGHYLRGDIFVIARTGFGKSLIFQAYSILTAKTTIQIVPMSKLGMEQYKAICRFSDINPCLITYQSKRENRKLLKELGDGKYTHILIGPEQACSKEFR
jgi:hypothetical protein